MNSPHALTAFSLRDVAGDTLLQESPYPVVAPRTVEMLALVVQYARIEGKKVMVLGTGSSFAEDFDPVSSEVIAIMTYRLSGVQKLSPFVTRILSGTPVSRVFSGQSLPERKTIGGLIASNLPSSDQAIGALYSRLLTIEMVNADADVIRLAGPNTVHAADPGLANALFGSQGRLGIIAAVEVCRPDMLELSSGNGVTPLGPAIASHESAIRRSDITRTFDPDGLFAW